MPTNPPEHIMQFFAFEHLPPHLQEVSKPFADLARSIVGDPEGVQSDRPFADGRLNRLALPRNPERTVALRKLLEAKDAAVRARLAQP